MVSSVTIHGSSHQTISLGFDSRSNFVLAEEIAARINAGIQAGTIVTEYDTSGTPTLPAGVTGAVVQTESGLVMLPQGYLIDLVTKPGPAVVFGSGAPGETILSDAKTDLTFLAASGSGTVVAGGGENNRISVDGSGSWSLYTGGRNDIIAAIGAVNATIGAGRGHNAILLGSGDDLVLSTGKDTI